MLHKERPDGIHHRAPLCVLQLCLVLVHVILHHLVDSVHDVEPVILHVVFHHLLHVTVHLQFLSVIGQFGGVFLDELRRHSTVLVIVHDGILHAVSDHRVGIVHLVLRHPPLVFHHLILYRQLGIVHPIRHLILHHRVLNLHHVVDFQVGIHHAVLDALCHGELLPEER